MKLNKFSFSVSDSGKTTKKNESFFVERLQRNYSRKEFSSNLAGFNLVGATAQELLSLGKEKLENLASSLKVEDPHLQNRYQAESLKKLVENIPLFSTLYINVDVEKDGVKGTLFLTFVKEEGDSALVTLRCLKIGAELKETL